MSLPVPRAASCALPAALLLAGLALGGCEWGDGGPPNPVPKPGLTLDGGSAEDAGLLDGGPAKRTLATRNPWGGPPGNLLADGDFEHSTVHPGNQPQLGWLTLDASGSNYKNQRFETGGLCRTGLRCALLERDEMLVGFGVSAPGTGMVASFWAKGPADKKCSELLSALVVGCWEGLVTGYVKATSPQPGADGWCHYQGSFPEGRTQRCLYINSKLVGDRTAVVDSAELAPDTGTVPTQEQVVVGAELQQRIDAATAVIRRRRAPAAPEADAPPGSPLRR
jgi:hypothetical protein